MNVPRWTYSLDFDAEGEPPQVWLHLDNGPALVLVEDEPLLVNGGDPEDEDAWSWEPKDWKLGPMGQSVLDTLNSRDEWPED